MITCSRMCVANQLSRQISTTSFGMHNVPWKSGHSGTSILQKTLIYIAGAYEWREPDLAIRADRCGGRDYLEALGAFCAFIANGRHRARPNRPRTAFA